MSFRIIGTGMYVPPKAVTNDDLAKIVDTNDEWITKRVGIKERRISETEFTSEMGAKAAKAALDDAGIQASDLDMILAATVSGETVSPSMACMIQNRLGATCPVMELIIRHGTVIPITRLIKCFTDSSGSTLSLFAINPTPIYMNTTSTLLKIRSIVDVPTLSVKL